MAKRKRLSPVAVAPTSDSDAPLETKALNGWVGVRRAPIADVTRDAATQAAFEEVSDELHRARVERRMVLSLPLDTVDDAYLVRDRVAMDTDELAELIDSLRARGQQAPIEVVDLGDKRYGLISGWRRLTALRQLAAEADDGSFSAVQALLRAPDGQGDAYRAMVEENEIRAALSFYERARIAVKAAEQGVYKSARIAVQNIFAAARGPKQSKIINFVIVVEQLDDVLRFPTSVPEKVGLALGVMLQKDPEFRTRLARALRDATPKTAAEERGVIDRLLKRATVSERSTPKPSSPEEIAPGVSLKIVGRRLTLSGDGVDAQFHDELRAWIAAR